MSDWNTEHPDKCGCKECHAYDSGWLDCAIEKNERIEELERRLNNSMSPDPYINLKHPTDASWTNIHHEWRDFHGHRRIEALEQELAEYRKQQETRKAFEDGCG